MSNQSEISSNTSVVTMNVNGYLIKANTDSDGHLTPQTTASEVRARPLALICYAL